MSLQITVTYYYKFRRNTPNPFTLQVLTIHKINRILLILQQVLVKDTINTLQLLVEKC